MRLSAKEKGDKVLHDGKVLFSLYMSAYCPYRKKTSSFSFYE